MEVEGDNEYTLQTRCRSERETRNGCERGEGWGLGATVGASKLAERRLADQKRAYTLADFITSWNSIR